MEGTVPQLRQNIITGDWVVIAPERSKRPQDFVIPKSVTVSDKKKCPFCINSEGYNSNEKIRGSATKNVYVIENKYPAFVDTDDESSLRSFYPEKGFYRQRISVGKHEVVVLKDHDTSLPCITNEIAVEFFEVIRDRYISIHKKENIASIMPIYNHGAESGASINHPHAQIFASGVIANTVGKEMTGANRYYGINGHCVFCDMVQHELKEKVRVVYENKNFLVATFYAARFPFETWIYPKHHESEFQKISKESMQDFVDCLMETLRKLDKTLENPPFNLYIHTLPTIEQDSESFHWHLEIIPRVSNFGGFELGSEVIIDVMSPEEAAEYLRKSEKG